MDNEHFSNKDIDAIDGKVSDNYFIPVFQDVLKEIKTAKEICDVGCGNGLFSLYLKDGENQQTELKVNETIELLNSMK